MIKKFFILLFIISAIGLYGENMENKINFKFDNKEITVLLNNNGAAESLLKQLPLEVKFENYGSVEKISYLSERLDVSEAPNSCSPKDGDLTYYSPWGNLAFFCQDFRNSNGLIPLGKIISGRENLDKIDKSSVVKIEKF